LSSRAEKVPLVSSDVDEDRNTAVRVTSYKIDRPTHRSAPAMQRAGEHSCLRLSLGAGTCLIADRKCRSRAGVFAGDSS
jgi:hypothetical protein